MNPKHLRDGVATLRALIHEASRGFEAPHEYMNIALPLTSLDFKPVPGQPVPRVAALRKALLLLDNVEESLDKVSQLPLLRQPGMYAVILGVVSHVSGILWAYGIDTPDEGQNFPGFDGLFGQPKSVPA